MKLAVAVQRYGADINGGAERHARYIAEHRRFAVDRERHPDDFGRHSRRVFDHEHSVEDELAWLRSEGPTSRRMVDHLATGGFDYVLLFSYRYYHAYQAARRLASKAILVPPAERYPAVGLSIFGPGFRSVRDIMYNSHE